VYNALVQKLAFHPGRHYRSHRDQLDSAALVESVNRLSGATPLADALRGCFRLGFGTYPVDGARSSTSDQVGSVVLSLFKALEMKDSVKISAEPEHAAYGARGDLRRGFV
jgi:hypothetical protein